MFGLIFTPKEMQMKVLSGQFFSITQGELHQTKGQKRNHENPSALFLYTPTKRASTSDKLQRIIHILTLSLGPSRGIEEKKIRFWCMDTLKIRQESSQKWISRRYDVEPKLGDCRNFLFR